MEPFVSRCRPGTCFVLILLASGCQHNRPCCSNCAASSTVAMGAPVAAPEAASASPNLAAPPGANGVPGVDPLLHQAPPSHSSANTPPALPSYEQGPATASAAGGKFGHDAKYHWLVGTLDYSRIQEAWVLRYVPVEEDDRYGGCVTLVVSGQMKNFKRGQTVRVEGSLIDPESQQLRPAFQVENIRIAQQ